MGASEGEGLEAGDLESEACVFGLGVGEFAGEVGGSGGVSDEAVEVGFGDEQILASASAARRGGGSGW